MIVPRIKIPALIKFNTKEMRYTVMNLSNSKIKIRRTVKLIKKNLRCFSRYSMRVGEHFV